MTKYCCSLSRREFIMKGAATALAAPALLEAAYGMRGPRTGANGNLRHACIGVGGMGAHDLQQFKAHSRVQIVALCDTDENNLKKAAELVPEARTYTDWRDLLKKERRNIDSVNVTVPDHNHFVIADQAIRRRKHVYCQKPMCHDVAEVRELTKAAVKKGVITQLGTQIASQPGDLTAVRLIKEQAIGKVRHVYLCSNRPGAIKTYRLVGPRPEPGQQPPAHLNWDLWLGTAPHRPYAPDIYHPAIWRSWQDFGTGWSGDIGCHIFDAVWKGLQLTAPESVIAEVQQSWKDSPARRGDTWPQGDHITWVFPGNDLTEKDRLTIEWFDGEFYPPEDVRALFSVENYPAESAMLVGTKGSLLIPHGGMPVLLPESRYSAYPHPEVPQRNHYHHFVEACLGGENTESHFAQTGPMTEAILLGTVAIRVPGQLLQWDAGNMRFPNYPEAERYLQRDYRKGW